MSDSVASVETYEINPGEWGREMLFAQRFDADHIRIGDPIQVAGPAGNLFVTSTTLLSKGKFVVAYNVLERPETLGSNDPHGYKIYLKEFGTDGTLLGNKLVRWDDSGFSGIEVKALSGSAYAYIVRSHVSHADEMLTTRTLGFVDAAGNVQETAINQDKKDYASGDTPHYHAGEPTLKLYADGRFSVQYKVVYEPDVLGFDDESDARPDPAAMQRSEKVYDASGHLEYAFAESFDGTRLTDRYDVTSGAKTSSTEMHADQTRIDTQYGITGRDYVEQSIERDAGGRITEMKRYYGDANHTKSFDLKLFADGTAAVQECDALGRPTVTQTGNMSGEHTTTQKTYAGTGTTPVTSVLTHYGAANIKEYTDTTKANGSHVQESLAAGVTLSSHGGAADTFLGFKGGSDTFAFAEGFGHDVVKGFASGAGAGHDILQFDSALLASASDFASHLQQVGGDTLVYFDEGNSILLKNVVATSLTADNVHILPHEGLMA